MENLRTIYNILSDKTTFDSTEREGCIAGRADYLFLYKKKLPKSEKWKNLSFFFFKDKILDQNVSQKESINKLTF